MIEYLINLIESFLEWLKSFRKKEVEQTSIDQGTKVLFAEKQTPVVEDQQYIFDFRGGGWSREKYCPSCFQTLTFDDAYSNTCTHCGSTRQFLLSIERVYRVIKFNGEKVKQCRYENHKFTIGDRTWFRDNHRRPWKEEEGDLHEKY